MTTIAMRWIARVLGAFLVVMILELAVGQGLPDFASLTSAERLALAATALMTLGLLLAYKWEGAGGTITLAAYLLLVASSRRVLSVWAFAFFAVTGALYVLYWFRTRKER
jgi:hypothetical protein